MKSIIKILITNSLLLLIALSVQAQTIKCPTPVIVGDADNYQVIYPLGWSIKGNFAYIHQDINTLATTDIFLYKVIIQDTKTNKILWSKTIEDSDYHNDLVTHIPGDETRYNYAYFKLVIWQKNKKEIKKKLNEYNIKMYDTFLRNIAGLSDISIKEKEIKKGDVTEDYEVIMYNTEKFKTVYKYECKQTKKACDDESIWYRTFAIKGYFKSPFGSRIAIIIFKIENGFEEPFEYPFIVGTHLNKDFKDITKK